MSDGNDPPRLRSSSAEASPEARALLELLRAERPDAEQLARLASRLPLGAPPGGGGGPAPSAPSGSAPPRTAPPPHPVAVPSAEASIVPSLLIGASLGLVVVGAVWLRGEMAAPTSTSRPPPVAAILTSAPAASAVGAPPAPRAAQPPEPHVSAAPPVAPAGAAPASVSAAPADAAETAAPSSPPPAGTDAFGFSGSETEVELVQRAQRALPADPARALAIAEEHRRRFTGGALAQEREVIAISALSALGRRDEMRARAAVFVESYPRSAHRPGVEALVPGLTPGRFDQKSDPDGGLTPDQ